jgi:hypothetical protein
LSSSFAFTPSAEGATGSEVEEEEEDDDEVEEGKGEAKMVLEMI